MTETCPVCNQPANRSLTIPEENVEVHLECWNQWVSRDD